MSLQFDEVTFKQRTRDMVAFLKEKGVEVPLTLGYEAVARHIFGAKSWNNLSSDLKKSAISASVSLSAGAAKVTTVGESARQASSTSAGAMGREVVLVGGIVEDSQLRYKYQTPGSGAVHLVGVHVHARVSSRPGIGHQEVDVSTAFHALTDDQILDLAAKKWMDPDVVLELVNLTASDNPLVTEVLRQFGPATKNTRTGAILRQDALPYVRAFRPHLLAKMLLVERYGDLDEAYSEGFYVTETISEGRWGVTACNAHVYPHRGTAQHFLSEADAWAALFYAMLVRTSAFEFEDFFRVLDGSGYHESIARLGLVASRIVRGWRDFSEEARDSDRPAFS